MELAQNFSIWVLFVFLIFQSYCYGYYPHKYVVGDSLSAKVNSITNEDENMPSSYYSLPFCKPLEGVKYGAEDPDEPLIGDRIENSPYRFKMYTNESEIFLCKSDSLSKDNIDLLKKRIDEIYQVNLILDNLPVIRYTKKDDYVSRLTGFPVGVKYQDAYYVFNHLKFTVLVQKYEENNVTHVMGTRDAAEVIPPIASEESDMPGYIVVGFEVVPCSVMHNLTLVKDLQMYGKYPNPIKLGSINESLPIEEGQPIVFTYEVSFEVYHINFDMSDFKRPSRSAAYAVMAGLKYYSFAILVSLMSITFFANMIYVIFLMTPSAGSRRYKELDKEAQAQMK